MSPEDRIAWIRAFARVNPNHIAVRYAEEEITFAKLDEATENVAGVPTESN